MDELVVLAEGEIEVEIEGKVVQPKIGEEVFISANALHTVRNAERLKNVWYYGYKNNVEINFLKNYFKYKDNSMRKLI